MIKLIVSDIDGTLLEDGGNAVNPELFDAVSYTHLDVYKRQGQSYVPIPDDREPYYD